jgi:pimeloyl-ACP methyl ester carboxylesterase
MERHEFHRDGLTFSYLDGGGDGRLLIALHGHLMEGATFVELAAALAPEWRVVALDQRGHGRSSHAPSYTRADYVGDLAALFEHLGAMRAVLLGSSLGGVNAYQFAARYPEKVVALIIEDIGAVVSDDISFVLPWAGTFATREALIAQVGARFAPYLEDSFRRVQGGWRLAFDPQEMVVSQGGLCGDHWKDWLATTCPALLIRGLESRVTTAEMVEQMAERRPNTVLVSLNGGHILHMDARVEFTQAVRAFLSGL